MIEIRPLQLHEVETARLLIFKVAHVVFKDQDPLEEAIAKFSARGALREMDDVQKNYFDNGGIFLVTVADGQIIGTGALRFLEADVCELKRMWLLPEYHGQGLGYRMMQKLFTIAKEKGYKVMRLQTDRDAQTQAVAFYTRQGFYEIAQYEGDDPEDMAMEIKLVG